MVSSASHGWLPRCTALLTAALLALLYIQTSSSVAWNNFPCRSAPGLVVRRAAEASSQAEDAAEKAMSLDDQFESAIDLIRGTGGSEQDQLEGIQLLRGVADQGHLESQYRIGALFLEQEDPGYLQWAVHYLNLAANQGDARATSRIGMLYLTGTGVEKDDEKAAAWISSAANAGLADAQARMGSLLLGGVGVEKNPEWAGYWFQQAADQGSVDAMYNLGLMYESGDGLEKDIEMAKYWLRKAMKAGDREAGSILGELERAQQR
mmetsp:Transcript_38963/g.77353  ORF Transcript_38963/g.77353 Transcript_38963/m.77353 type:complete len:264 (-) Transcript_38963:35-826(-)